ncbi:MAG: hypothetical protein ACXVII_29135, partial [Solirubrobacteraceae bacterium]
SLRRRPPFRLHRHPLLAVAAVAVAAAAAAVVAVVAAGVVWRISGWRGRLIRCRRGLVTQ